MNFLIKWLLPLIETTGAVELLKLLQGLHDAHPASYKTAIVAIYPVIDVQVEDYVKTTKTTIDDEIIAKLKGVLEQSAAVNGVILPNLDAGTIND